uniref:Peptidase S9 prolyl oligopeptidase catalytic domain-containing protein n=1 Tax=Alexandrium monilatum TaxID=311494 RepID=A0A7S4QDC1_9DINO
MGAAVKRIAAEVRARAVLLCGYSMGGFGALQLGSRTPELFDAIVMVAGHGLGTLEPSESESAYAAPQPESSRIFKDYLARHAPRLASVPKVIAVHAWRDKVSSYTDAEAIVDAIQARGGCAELVTVPDDMADSDLGRGKNRHRRGHCYYGYAFLRDSSEEVLYSRLREALPKVRLVAKPPARELRLMPARPQERGAGWADRGRGGPGEPSAVPADAEEGKARRGRWRRGTDAGSRAGWSRSRSPRRR